ncbi:unnamed protein product [Ilex paraguariensis]|uniref:Protein DETOXIFICATION n=1 Tax=Ilex paraguariensis TaxID=185542 RepID=A0ABC8SAR0_9AQUA
MNEATMAFSPQQSRRIHNFSRLVIRKGLSYADVVRRCSLATKHRPMLTSPLIHRRKHIFKVSNYQSISDCGVHSSDVDETPSTEEHDLSSSREKISEPKGICPSESSSESGKELTGISTSQSRHQDVKRELVMLSLPAIAGQAVDPFVQLMETAYIGRLGPVELASAGVSISIFNIISKLFNMPLVSVATSFVAEDLSMNAVSSPTGEGQQEGNINGKLVDRAAKRQELSSVSTALTLAVGIGIFEAVALSLGSGLFLNLMGISSANSMHTPAQRFLSLRALGAPANVVSLALQGIFRGFKDTKTPVLCLGKFLSSGNFSAIFLLPILIYYFRLGLTGAAISTVVSQYIVTFLMMWYLNKRVVLFSPKVGALRFGGYLKSGGFLLGRTLALLTTTTLATSMAARQGPLAMAAHQICFQVWFSVSLLTDALAISAQSLIATSISQGDYRTVKEVTYFVLKIGLVTGVALALVLGISFGKLATLFTSDADVLGIVTTGVLISHLLLVL